MTYRRELWMFLAKRVKPLQLRKSSEISVRTLESQSMLNRERGEMRIGNEVRYRISVVEQPS